MLITVSTIIFRSIHCVNHVIILCNLKFVDTSVHDVTIPFMGAFTSWILMNHCVRSVWIVWAWRLSFWIDSDIINQFNWYLVHNYDEISWFIYDTVQISRGLKYQMQFTSMGKPLLHHVHANYCWQNYFKKHTLRKPRDKFLASQVCWHFGAWRHNQFHGCVHIMNINEPLCSQCSHFVSLALVFLDRFRYYYPIKRITCI